MFFTVVTPGDPCLKLCIWGGNLGRCRVWVFVSRVASFFYEFLIVNNLLTSPERFSWSTLGKWLKTPHINSKSFGALGDSVVYLS